MEQRDVLRHRGDGCPKTVLGHLHDILAADKNTAFSHVVEPLDKREQPRLPAARTADETDPLTGFDVQIEIGKHLFATRIGKADVAEGDAAGIPLQRHRLRMVAKVMRDQEGGERLGKARHVLRCVDEGDGEIARGMEHGNTESANEHHLARRDQVLLPEQNGPRHQRDRQRQ